MKEFLQLFWPVLVMIAVALAFVLTVRNTHIVSDGWEFKGAGVEKSAVVFDGIGGKITASSDIVTMGDAIIESTDADRMELKAADGDNGPWLTLRNTTRKGTDRDQFNTVRLTITRELYDAIKASGIAYGEAGK